MSRDVTDRDRQHERIAPFPMGQEDARKSRSHHILLSPGGADRSQKIVRTFYANITNPGEAEPDSEHEDGPGAGGSSAPPDPPMDVDVEQVGVGRGISESIEGESAAAAAQRKKGGYMREGPTVYKLIKPVLKSIKDAKSLE